jgi:integrase/recombinase XerC
MSESLPNSIVKADNAEDIVSLLLADKRSENTKRAYRYDLHDFFQTRYGVDPTPELIGQFLALSADRIAFHIAVYKGDLISRNLSEATVNRRLAAIHSLVDYARRIGLTDANIAGLIRGEKVIPYRDTSGITSDQAIRLLSMPDRSTLKGKRDYAILLLLLENALRSAEIRMCRVSDFHPQDSTLRILGKGAGTQRSVITINDHTVSAIQDYLQTAGHASQSDAPLFQSCHRRATSSYLTGDGLYKIVGEYARRAGIEKRVSPHRLRHTSITTALDVTGGNVAVVQQLSRHASVDTVVRYNDNRVGSQARVTAMLGEVFAAVVEEPESPTLPEPSDGK